MKLVVAPPAATESTAPAMVRRERERSSSERALDAIIILGRGMLDLA